MMLFYATSRSHFFYKFSFSLITKHFFSGNFFMQFSLQITSWVKLEWLQAMIKWFLNSLNVEEDFIFLKFQVRLLTERVCDQPESSVDRQERIVEFSIPTWQVRTDNHPTLPLLLLSTISNNSLHRISNEKFTLPSEIGISSTWLFQHHGDTKIKIAFIGSHHFIKKILAREKCILFKFSLFRTNHLIFKGS